MTPSPLDLRDIHLPEPVSWWPPALGWWLLPALLALVVMSGLLFRHWSHRHRLRRTALDELERLTLAYAKHQDVQLLTTELSALLRRVCLARYPAREVAGVAGLAWLQFLDRHLPSPGFSQGPGQALITAPFQRHPQVEVDALLAICRQWILAIQPQRSRPS